MRRHRPFPLLLPFIVLIECFTRNLSFPVLWVIPFSLSLQSPARVCPKMMVFLPSSCHQQSTLRLEGSISIILAGWPLTIWWSYSENVHIISLGRMTVVRVVIISQDNDDDRLPFQHWDPAPHCSVLDHAPPWQGRDRRSDRGWRPQHPTPARKLKNNSQWLHWLIRIRLALVGWGL